MIYLNYIINLKQLSHLNSLSKCGHISCFLDEDAICFHTCVSVDGIHISAQFTLTCFIWMIRDSFKKISGVPSRTVA